MKSNDDLPTTLVLQDMQMPIHSPGLSTFAYQRALLNRVQEALILPDGRFDTQVYTSAFVHDILMLPGSLANLLEKSTPDILAKLTPALLPGYQTDIDSETLLPYLTKSSDPISYVQGMLILGISKGSRRTIHRHYRRFDGARRHKATVEIEVTVNTNAWSRQLHRRSVRTYIWTTSSIVNEHTSANSSLLGRMWTIEDYLAGKLEGNMNPPLRVEADAKGDEDEDGYIGRDMKVYEVKAGRREVVYGGAGTLEYERADAFTGW